jgi:hypothetical protein
MGYIYILTSPNGKSYIGQTTKRRVGILVKAGQVSESVLSVFQNIKPHINSNGRMKVVCNRLFLSDF